MIEILGGDGLENAFAALGIDAVRTYKSHPGEEYEVWEISKDDFDKLFQDDLDEWPDDWGWCRHAEGSNMGPVTTEYIVNGESLMAWDGVKREYWCNECVDGVCSGSDEERLVCYGPRIYKDLFEYSCEEVGASTERNFCAIAIDLAKQNGMKLSELFQKYMG